MSGDILNLEFGADQHPEETQLLLALERELPPAEAAAVERHIGTCWDCRARYHEMHRGILAFVEYRDKLYLPELEPAPRDFHQFPSLQNRAAAEGRRAGLLDRIGSRIRGFFSSLQVSLPVRWVTATAVVMTVVTLWMQVFSPTTLSASELLIKAAQSQNPPAAIHRKVRQIIRVKSGETESVREFQWETGSPIPGAKWGTDPENWTAPMTAQGFSQWHDSLSAPKDNVTKSGDRWTLDTVALAGPIKEASMVIHKGDFHPIEQHIRFVDERTIDLQEISFEAVGPTPDDSASSQIRPTPQAGTAPSRMAPATAINLDEAELELRYAMFVQHLDADEDLQISRAAGAVLVSGIANSAERLQQLQTALAGLSGVHLSISVPGLAVGGAAPAPSQKPAIRSTVPLLKDRLEAAFVSADARRDFVDSCLSISDTALSQAWALKKLAERYTVDARLALKSESRAKVDEMMRGHLDQVAAANLKLNSLLELLPSSRTSGDDASPANQHGSIATLFDLVQRQDSLVAALVAGTQTTDTAAVAADNFRAEHEAIARLASEIKPMQ